nr:MAG TPA: hypothetical protein [Caudoviricetes sp.]
MMKVTGNHTEKEIWDAICTLSDIRAECNLFDPNDVKKYEACSMGILALREVSGVDKN